MTGMLLSCTSWRLYYETGSNSTVHPPPHLHKQHFRFFVAFALRLQWCSGCTIRPIAGGGTQYSQKGGHQQHHGMCHTLFRILKHYSTILYHCTGTYNASSLLFSLYLSLMIVSRRKYVIVILVRHRFAANGRTYYGDCVAEMPFGAYIFLRKVVPLLLLLLPPLLRALTGFVLLLLCLQRSLFGPSWLLWALVVCNGIAKWHCFHPSGSAFSAWKTSATLHTAALGTGLADRCAVRTQPSPQTVIYLTKHRTLKVGRELYC